jgi:hypothetical protein
MTIHHSEAAPPWPTMPKGYVGPLLLPGTGRLVFWTGRVAIGLLHQAPANQLPSRDALRLQRLLLEQAA